MFRRTLASGSGRINQNIRRHLSTESAGLILKSTTNGVTTLVMNNPARLNGWTEDMMQQLFSALDEAAGNDETKVVRLAPLYIFNNVIVRNASNGLALALAWVGWTRALRLHQQP